MPDRFIGSEDAVADVALHGVLMVPNFFPKFTIQRSPQWWQRRAAITASEGEFEDAPLAPANAMRALARAAIAIGLSNRPAPTRRLECVQVADQQSCRFLGGRVSPSGETIKIAAANSICPGAPFSCASLSKFPFGKLMKFLLE
jgi:hypothetical protein